MWDSLPVGISGKIALVTSYDRVSYGELEQKSNALASTFGDMDRGDIVLFLKPDSDYYVALLACKMAGLTAIPADIQLPIVDLRAQWNRINAACVVTTSELLEVITPIIQDESTPIICMDQLQIPSVISSVIFEKRTSDTVLHKVFTSGSSGEQSLVSIPLMAMEHDVSTVPSIYGFQQDSVIANLGHYTSSMGINSFWRAYYIGSTFVRIDIRNENAQQSWKRIIDSGAIVLQGQTTLTLKLLRSLPEGSVNRNIEHLIIGGEPLQASQLAYMMHFFPSLDRVSYNYSSTETMLIASYTADPYAMLQLHKIPIGVVAPNKVVRIVDDMGEPVKNGDIGQIVVQSSYISSHIDSVKGSRRLIRVSEETKDRVYFTGDLGRFNDAGLLEHYGRLDSEIKLRGVRINPALIEAELLKVQGIKEALVTTLPHAHEPILVAAAVCIGINSPSEKMIFNHLAQTLPLSHLPKHVIFVSKLPQLPNGKPDYKIIQVMLAEHIFESQPEIHVDINTRSEIQVAIISVWEKVIQRKITSTECSIFSLGADSLAIFQASIQLNNHFSLSLDVNWILDHQSIDEQEHYLTKMLASVDQPGINMTPEQVRSMLGWV
jgi:acyl-coenzyme A synthetase/AMP-(fatty) acid ligase